MIYLKVVALALFVVAVIAKLVYIVVKTVRIVVLQVDPPMVGFDSETVTEAYVPEVREEDYAREILGPENVVLS